MTGASPAASHPGEDALWDPTAIPAATVIVVRDTADGVQTLMLHRNNKLSFAGGMWVFPGGRLDPVDLVGAGLDPDQPVASQDPTRIETAARLAAVRETFEETGLVLDIDSIRRWSHWTPPPEAPKRFSTAFFVASIGSGDAEVVVDHGEIRDHRWLGPAAVITQHSGGVIGLTPPTFITLTHLLSYTSSEQIIAATDGHDFERFATRFVIDGEKMMALYHGDAGYEDGVADTPGRRHRLTMGTEWLYERDN